MSIDSAKKYMQRMRDDPAFRKAVNDCEDPADNWAFLRANGYEFTVDEFKKAQSELMDMHGADAFPKMF